MLNTKTKGDISEARALYEFQRFNIPVCIPWGDNQRYDMIAEFNGKFNRIQVKTCNIEENGSIICTCHSFQNHATNKSYNTYKEDVDFFVFFNQTHNKIAIVPIEIIGDNVKISLRILPPLNNQIKNIKYFDDFSFEKFFRKEQDVIKQVKDSTAEKKLKSNQKSNFKCKNCGKEISNKATYCIECRGKMNQKVERPSREELKKMIRTIPFTQIAQQFGVSDNAIRKWCDSYKLPRKKMVINNYTDEDWEKI